MPYGVSSKQSEDGFRPVQQVNASAVGMVGDAPEADDSLWPYNTPIRVAGERDLKGIGAGGTLPRALNAALKQGGAEIVVVRTAPSTANDLSNIIGGIDNASGDFEGIYALKAARSEIGVTPRIIVTPGYSHMKAVADAMINVADANRGYVYADGPDTNNADAINYRKEFGSDRIRIHDPSVKTNFNGDEILLPISAMLAGARAVMDQEKGWHWSLSNAILKGVLGTSRPIDFAYNDPNCVARYLIENRVATVALAEGGGYKTIGNRGCASDPAWEFESIRRANDIIADSIDRSLSRWAPDRPLNRAFFEAVATTVTSYCAELQSDQKILGGRVWVDWDKTTPATMAAGKARFGRDLTVPAPAEDIEIEYLHTTDYYDAVIGS